MSSGIELGVFDYLDDFREEVRNGEVAFWDSVEPSSSPVLFCEGLYEQFFATELKKPFRGINRDSKRIAARYAEESRKQRGSATTRRIITCFEAFCDIYEAEIRGNYGEGSLTYEEFFEPFVGDLLDSILKWAGAKRDAELAERVRQALSVYSETWG